MNIKTYSRGEIIFREGDAGDCVYELSYGSVGSESPWRERRYPAAMLDVGTAEFWAQPAGSCPAPRVYWK